MQCYLLSLSVSLSPGAEQEPQRMRVMPPDNGETEMDGRRVDGWTKNNALSKKMLLYQGGRWLVF